MDTVQVRSRDLVAWALAKDVTVADAALDINTRPASGAAGMIALEGAPLLAVRAFLTDAANEAAVFDVLLWDAGCRTARHACRIQAVAGTGSRTGHPHKEGADAAVTFLVADRLAHNVISGTPAGSQPPEIRSRPNEAAIAYVDTGAAAYAQVRCEAMTSAARLIVLARPVDAMPPPLEVPFHGNATGTATTFNNTNFSGLPLAEGGLAAELAAPGSGWECVIDEIVIVSSAGATFAIEDGTNIIVPETAYPAGMVVRSFGPDGMVCTAEARPQLTSTGAVTATIEIRGRMRPIQQI